MQSSQEEVPAAWQGSQGGASWETRWPPIVECLSGKGNKGTRRGTFSRTSRECPEGQKDIKPFTPQTYSLGWSLPHGRPVDRQML